jgi:hypothetical protein
MLTGTQARYRADKEVNNRKFQVVAGSTMHSKFSLATYKSKHLRVGDLMYIQKVRQSHIQAAAFEERSTLLPRLLSLLPFASIVCIAPMFTRRNIGSSLPGRHGGAPIGT